MMITIKEIIVDAKAVVRLAGQTYNVRRLRPESEDVFRRTAKMIYAT